MVIKYWSSGHELIVQQVRKLCVAPILHKCLDVLWVFISFPENKRQKLRTEWTSVVGWRKEVIQLCKGWDKWRINVNPLFLDKSTIYNVTPFHCIICLNNLKFSCAPEKLKEIWRIKEYYFRIAVWQKFTYTRGFFFY